MTDEKTCEYFLWIGGQACDNCGKGPAPHRGLAWTKTAHFFAKDPEWLHVNWEDYGPGREFDVPIFTAALGEESLRTLQSLYVDTEPVQSPTDELEQLRAENAELRETVDRLQNQAVDTTERLARMMAFQRILMDLTRNSSGRHEGDADVFDIGGISRGNPHIRPGDIIGYNMAGRPYVMPTRDKKHDPRAWEGEF